MAPRTSASKSKGKASVHRSGPGPATPAVFQPRAPRPINPEVLEALQTLWGEISGFLFLNSKGPMVSMKGPFIFLKEHMPVLVCFLAPLVRIFFFLLIVFFRLQRNYRAVMQELQEDEPEVGYRARLWYVFVLSLVEPAGAIPDNWREHIPEVSIDDLSNVSNLFSIFIYLLICSIIHTGTFPAPDDN